MVVATLRFIYGPDETPHRPLTTYECFLAFLIIVGVLLRIWTWQFFEFKADQARAISDTSQTAAGRSNFLLVIDWDKQRMAYDSAWVEQ